MSKRIKYNILETTGSDREPTIYFCSVFQSFNSILNYQEDFTDVSTDCFNKSFETNMSSKHDNETLDV